MSLKKIFHFPFKEDWDGAPTDHEMKRPGRQEEKNQGSTWFSQITEK
jgi:hypothetical protein